MSVRACDYDAVTAAAPLPERRRPGRPEASSRDRVQLAAVRLFLERGYAATTMDDVAEAAGVGRTTVFRYFSGKPALVWWDLDANYARLDTALATAAPPATIGEALDQVRDAVHEALVDMSTDSELMRQRWVLVDQDSAVAAELAVLMMRWAARIAGHLRDSGLELPAATADAVGYAVLGATVGATRSWSAGGDLSRPLTADMDEVMGPLTAALQSWVTAG